MERVVVVVEVEVEDGGGSVGCFLLCVQSVKQVRVLKWATAQKSNNKDNNNNNSIPKQLQENLFDCLYLQHCTCDAYLYDWTFLAMSALLVGRN